MRLAAEPYLKISVIWYGQLMASDSGAKAAVYLMNIPGDNGPLSKAMFRYSGKSR